MSKHAAGGGFPVRGRALHSKIMRSPRSYKLVLFAALVLLALLGMGCGGEDEEPEPEPVHLGHWFDRMGLADFSTDPTVRESVEGTNGLFVESCDADGNLKIFGCAMRQVCEDENACAPFPNGEVQTGIMDCAGQCMAGTCPK